MNALLKLVLVELKLFFREPIGALFTLAFPLLALFVFGSIFGNEPFPGSDLGTVDVSTPGYMAMIIGTVALMGLPVSLATYRSEGILRRFRATPLHPSLLLGAHIIVQFLMAVFGMLLLVAAARLVYGLKPPASPGALIPAVLISSAGFFALGAALAGLLPTPRTAQAVGMALFFPMLFLSGAAMPLEMLPATIRHIADFLPLTHVNLMISGLWFESSWNLVSLMVLVGMALFFGFLAVLTFRWE